MPLFRTIVAALAAAVVFLAAWLGLEQGCGVDRGIALAIAAVAMTLVILIAAVRRERSRHSLRVAVGRTLLVACMAAVLALLVLQALPLMQPTGTPVVAGSAPCRVFAPSP
jgi:hypothetical protein